VQRSNGHAVSEPLEELDAVREFARTCAENAADVRPVDVPGETAWRRACRTARRSRP
jgi:hypothetical protein